MQLTEALQLMLQTMDSKHPLVAADIHHVWSDLDLDPVADGRDPMELLVDAPCFDHAATWATWKRTGLA